MNETPSYADWLGRTTQIDDVLTPAPVKALSATLDRDDPLPAASQALPPLWYWLYFLPSERQSEISADGHPRRGSWSRRNAT
jgi:3-methylfumaryl-CoA hydratase